MAIDFALHQDLQTALPRDDVDMERVQPLLEQFRRSGVAPEKVSLEFVFRQVLEKAALRWQASPDDAAVVEPMKRVLAALEILPFDVNLWVAKNAAY